MMTAPDFHGDASSPDGLICATDAQGQRITGERLALLLSVLNGDVDVRVTLSGALIGWPNGETETMASRAFADRDRLHKGIVEIAVALGISTSALKSTSISDQYDELIGLIKAAIQNQPPRA